MYVSFTYFLLDCSRNITLILAFRQRSLGVHISFVRSIAMDSWTDQQLKLMKCGGNQKCAQYLSAKGIASGTAIKQKYESDAAQLYKEVLKARAEGRPEPTELVKKAPRSNSSYASSSAGSSMHGGGMGGAAGKPGEDPNGMERLTGETDEQYVARQTRLRDEAKARMAAKFGGGGGMGGVGVGSGGGMGGVGGGGRMGGIGSDSSYNPATGGYGGGMGGGVDVNAVTDSLVSGFGAAFGALGSAATAATATASTFVSDPGTQQTITSLKSSVTSSAGGFWGSLTAGASAVASAVTAPDDAGDDGLADLQRQFSQQRGAHPSKYSGFGSDSASGGGGAASSMMSNNSAATYGNTATTTASAAPAPASGEMSRHLPGEDPNGIERLTGETDDQYVARQTRLRDEARARMAAKFGGGGMGGVGSSSGGGGGMGGMGGGGMGGFGSSAPAPMSAPAPKPVVAAPAKPPSSGNSIQDMKKKMQTSDDFFASFGS